MDAGIEESDDLLVFSPDGEGYRVGIVQICRRNGIGGGLSAGKPEAGMSFTEGDQTLIITVSLLNNGLIQPIPANGVDGIRGL